ncbi:serine protease inhibitor dipetalogastin-like [Drosophila santomea]|uniref:serine protease inhibitor dipetalogastin-like n=1 Tax=Drosophila santomea TaxID=129105 RepID=UPI0019538809|nr:serine protease inhibitor dipetalogastin-like [Drosophila santomea]
MRCAALIALCLLALLGHLDAKGQTLENLPHPGFKEKPTSLCLCPFTLLPVCGANGKTYSNDCLLNCDKVRLSKLGACDSKHILEMDEKKPYFPINGSKTEPIKYVPGFERGCACPLHFDPVCGSDMKSYANECFLNCKNVGLGRQGKCDDKDDIVGPGILGDGLDPWFGRLCGCTFLLSPVCGVDGKSYANACRLECENVRLLKDGLCNEKDTIQV